MAVSNIVLNGARLVFRNFAGRATKFTPEGKRTVCVLIDPDLACRLRADGWTVKTLQPRDAGDVPQDYLSVNVHYGEHSSPKIYMLSGQFVDGKDGEIKFKNRVLLDENTVSSLDYAEISNVDICIRPYEWEMGGKTGVKGYLKTMYVTLVEDEFASKYGFDDGFEDEELPFN